MNENAIVPHNGGEVVMSLTAKDVSRQVQLIQEVMTAVMKEGEHYGVIPGCGKKPSLFKAGAEKINLVFRHRSIMSDDNDIKIVNLPNGHREVFVKCHILNAHGEEVATGVGSCTTMESKYRYRQDSDYEDTGEEIPKDAKEKKREYRKQGLGMKNVDGQWLWVRYLKTEKVENPDIADTYNTVLKMGKKRAYVDGTITASGASDFFSQDLEDLQKDDDKPAKSSAPAETHTPPQRKSVTQPAAPVIKEYTGKVDRKFSSKGKSKYFSYTLAEHSGVYFQTSDEAVMETLAQHRIVGNTITLKVEETVNGEYTNRLITEIIVNAAEATVGAEATGEERAY